MKMNRRLPLPGEYRSRSIFMGLILAVLVTSAGILFFMQRAMSNEQLAARQRLLDVYRGQMLQVGNEMEGLRQAILDAFSLLPEETPGSVLFAELKRSGHVGSAICFDESGNVNYPSRPSAPGEALDELSTQWQEAEALEYQDGKPEEAAVRYAEITQKARSAHTAARAIQAQARCLAKAQKQEQAIELLKELSGPRFRQAVDAQGRLIAPGGLLMAVNLMNGKSGVENIVLLLKDLLDDYGNTSFPASQRRFLMRELKLATSGRFQFPMLEAEELAALWIESGGMPGEMSLFEKSAVEGVWQISSRRITALFKEEALMMRLEALSAAPTEDFKIHILLPGEAVPGGALETMPAGPGYPGWRLALSLSAHTNAQMEAEQNTSFFLWMGLLVVFSVLLIGGLTTRFILGQLSSTRLKNDLLATVSHELKTPLSSVRMLVDTLLDGHYKDQDTTREYLELIARENRRLSRLIDNFLDFSKMERQQTSFKMDLVSPGDIVEAAMESMSRKLENANFTVEVDMEPNLPELQVDLDAMTRVLINLLDNARKYSEDVKYIRLTVRKKGKWMLFEVTDKGIGMSRRETKKVFERFFQADRSLARKTDGVGLGLNIVQHIVASHNGKVKVESQIGKGSVFTAMVPLSASELT